MAQQQGWCQNEWPTTISIGMEGKMAGKGDSQLWDGREMGWKGEIDNRRAPPDASIRLWT